MQNHLYENVFRLQVYFHANHNSFSYERFCTRTRFETEAQGESEMACYMKLKRCAGKPVRVSHGLFSFTSTTVFN